MEPKKQSSTSSATSTPPSDTAMQTRIITHMNADHSDSLSLFLQHYNHLPASQTHSATLDTFTLTHITLLSATKQRYYIPLSPPLSSYADARTRMVAMHNTALTGLGLHPITITSYTPPKMGWQLALFGLCLISLVSFSPLASPDLSRTAPRSRVNLVYAFWSLGGLWPGLAYFAHDVAGYVFGFIVIVHAAETAWFARSRLRRHRVEVGGLVWWQWVMSCFVEGFGSFVRLDGVVREEEEKKSKGKAGKEH